MEMEKVRKYFSHEQNVELVFNLESWILRSKIKNFKSVAEDLKSGPEKYL